MSCVVENKEISEGGEIKSNGSSNSIVGLENSVSQNGSVSDSQFNIDDKLLIDPRLLAVRTKIGEGAHGKVYEGKYGDQVVAIKVLNCGNTPVERAVLEGRFAREINMMCKVKHENLVKFIGACKDPYMVIVTELLPGMSLRRYLLNIRPELLELRVAIGYALDIARAMECLHANGIIHRDLKPGTVQQAADKLAKLLPSHEFVEIIPSSFAEDIKKIVFDDARDNLLLTENQKSVKLADFGLAREESVTEMMTAETGTYRWMAPELYSTVTLRRGEKKHYNNKVDVYSFGIVLWELLTNRMPFEGMSNLQAAYAAAFKQMRPNLPEDIHPDLAFIIQSCWVEDPNVRPSFSQIIRLLNTFRFTVLPPSSSLPESDTIQPEVQSNGVITESSARSRGKFSFIRQLFAAKKTKNNTQ